MKRGADTATGQKPAKQAAVSSDLEDFKSQFATLRQELLREVTDLKLPKLVEEYMAKMIDYNVPGGKLTRGVTVVKFLEALRQSQGKTVSEEDLAQAQLLGWCVELLQAFFLVADDVMDDSITRRGHPCWFRVDGIGLKAVNDASILYTCIFLILRKHFRKHPSYLSLIELFNEVCFKTQMGQLMDLESLPDGKLDLDRFTNELYHSIVVFKTAFYSFYLPVALAMHLAGYTDQAALKDASSVCEQIGEYFQIQDDYLDCYGDEATIGKIGTDIEDAKCGWLVVTALQHVSPAQRQVLQVSYGKKDAVHVAAVKQVYNELDLTAKFHAFEEESFSRITGSISKVSTMPQTPLTWLLGKIYKRDK